ncbi:MULTISPECIES: type II toxin-antitoxin system RelE family toxin [unclassified Rhizobium]|uniref:type II toxin-antitoxin system RelE family toxin n=1 Tax=unclassified Rhizobium TaxID=2613769 RepID=UPI000712A66D|nr:MULTISPECIES: type II toxin-antitoxin system RelE/ParE family toxin [unclassified Rhizobium]KQS99174.1 cytotoxic translational repressor of toxin-antitoxin stability system [Rhizobium sp. Leaf386]KQT05352.1 cytotoxic translational repressor of toxin-antitoxin stability system [Rhizobium sp. Leaf391]KQT91794.1 cytotoxic translational repressor of toxin-antitoxin stability system [Rhizobium sp. Leaf453]
MRVIYDKEAIKALTRMPATDAKRIRQKIQQYAEDPASLANNVKKLQDIEYYRLRVGDWRVIFSEDGLVVDVIKIAGRGEVYKGLKP